MDADLAVCRLVWWRKSNVSEGPFQPWPCADLLLMCTMHLGACTIGLSRKPPVWWVSGSRCLFFLRRYIVQTGVSTGLREKPTVPAPPLFSRVAFRWRRARWGAPEPRLENFDVGVCVFLGIPCLYIRENPAWLMVAILRVCLRVVDAVVPTPRPLPSSRLPSPFRDVLPFHVVVRVSRSTSEALRYAST